jgi:hypothetical protein
VARKISPPYSGDSANQIVRRLSRQIEAAPSAHMRKGLTASPFAHLADGLSPALRSSSDFSFSRRHRTPPQIQARVTTLAATVGNNICTLTDLMEPI